MSKFLTVKSAVLSATLLGGAALAENVASTPAAEPSTASQPAAKAKPDNAKAASTLRHYLQSIDVMQARFTQIVMNETNEELDRATGDFTMAKPGKFFWDYKQPDKHQLISNGDKVWQYDIELSQVNVRPAAAVIAGSPAEVLAKPETLHRDYVVRDSGTKSGVNWIQLLPRDPESSFKDILIGLKDGQLNVMRFIDKQEQNTTIHFHDMKTAVEIDQAMFDFKAPQGVEVVDQ